MSLCSPDREFDVDAAEAFMNSVATGESELAFIGSALRGFVRTTSD